MTIRFPAAACLGVIALTAALFSAGCQGQADKDTIGAAPPAPTNAKAPAPVTNKPGPVGGGDSASGGGGGSSAAAPVPAGGK